MATRYQMGWARFLPFLGYHHVIMVFLLIGIICYSIVIAGCTTTGLSNVYLLSLNYVQAGAENPKPDLGHSNPNISSIFRDLAASANESSLQVRAGYLGICIIELAGDWICSTSDKSLANIFRERISVTGNQTDFGGDPLNLIWIAGKFRHEIVFNGLIFTAIPLSFIGIILLATFPGWHEEDDENGSERDVKPFPSRPVSQVCLAILSLATVFMFVSVFWQHIGAASASTMAQTLSYGTIRGRVGPVAMTLGWTGFAFTTLSMVGLLVIILSIRVLSREFDSHSSSHSYSASSSSAPTEEVVVRPSRRRTTREVIVEERRDRPSRR